MKSKILAIALCAALSGCIELDTTTVSTQQVILASDTFNLAETTAIAYLKLPPCPTATLCRTASVVKLIDVPLRAGYAARKRLVTAARNSTSGSVNVSDFAVLTGAISTLRAIYTQYNIGG